MRSQQPLGSQRDKKIMARFIVILVTVFLMLPSASRAASPEVIESLTAKLESWDVEGDLA